MPIHKSQQVLVSRFNTKENLVSTLVCGLKHLVGTVVP